MATWRQLTAARASVVFQPSRVPSKKKGTYVQTHFLACLARRGYCRRGHPYDHFRSITVDANHDLFCLVRPHRKSGRQGLVVLTNIGLERYRADPLTGATSRASPLSTECAGSYCCYRLSVSFHGHLLCLALEATNQVFGLLRNCRFRGCYRGSNANMGCCTAHVCF